MGQAMTDKTRRKQGKWAKGTSGNSKGRPRGSRNKTTLAAQALLDGEDERLTRKAIQLALGGDTTALRLCLERLLPPRRDRPISHELPSLATTEDAVRAFASLARSVGLGEITPGEAGAVSKLVDSFVNALAVNEFEQRLKAVEDRFHHDQQKH